LLARLRDRFIDLQAQFQLQLVEGSFDLLVFTASLVNSGDAFFEINARFDCAKYLVASSENAFEQSELLRQQFVDAAISFVLPIQKIHHHDVVFLAVSMRSANSLLDPLRIPRQIVIYDERAKLKVDSFGSRFGGDHDAAVFAKIINECRPHVRAFGAGYTIGASVSLDPVPINLLGSLVSVRPIEKNDAFAEWAVAKDSQQIVLSSSALRKNNRFLFGPDFGGLLEGNVERFDQRFAFCVVID
jgi:hypothetical protein